jgi:hypothetical protein
MHFRRVFDQARIDLAPFLRRDAYRPVDSVPSHLPALAKHATWSRSSSRGKAYYFPVVCGGVGLDMAIRDASFHRGCGEDLASLRRRIIAGRPSADSLAWVLPP